jgi:UDP-N-acetylmuramoyl-L-alanyl-D-glutamate--2,6-diaminopimelate ligase
VATPSTDDPGAPAQWRATDPAPAADGVGTRFVLRGPDGEAWQLTSPLPGGFNVANTAVAALVLRLAGLGPADVTTGLEAAGGVPGRMEVVAPAAGGAEPLAVVDYAHTPQAVAVALQALRPRTSGPLVVVLGAGGDRDPGKRAAMGAAAAQEADVVVVTDDNPRSEDPAAIRAAVLAGARQTAGAARGEGREVHVLEVGDRAQAVAVAVEHARRGPGGTVLVAGKGHESGQEVAGTVHPFDDREVLAGALRAAGAPAGGGAR